MMVDEIISLLHVASPQRRCGYTVMSPVGVVAGARALLLGLV